MKFVTSQIEKSNIPEWAGFKAEEMDTAVRTYLKLYEENTELPLFLLNAVNASQERVIPVGSSDCIVEKVPTDMVPLSSDNSPFKNGITLGLSITDQDKIKIDEKLKCDDLNPSEVKDVLSAIKNFNEQLEGEGMPGVFFKSAAFPTVKDEKANNNQVDIANPVIHIRSCKNLVDTGALGDYTDRWTKETIVTNRGDIESSHLEARIRLEQTKEFIGAFSSKSRISLLAHEISHMFATHPQDAVDLTKVHPELLAYMCSYSDRAGTRGSSLIYEDACDKYSSSIPLVKFQKLGPIEMLRLKKFYNSTETERLQDVDRAIGEIVKDIRVQYGTRITSQAMAGFFAALVFSSMAHSLTGSSRHIHPKKMLWAVSSFSQIVGLAVIVSQLPDRALSNIAATGAFSLAGMISQSSKALSGLLSSAGLGMAFLSLYRGQSGLAVGLAATYGGALVGRVCAEVFNTLRSGTLERPAGYMEGHYSDLKHLNIERLNSCADRAKSLLKQATPEPLSNVVTKIGELDKALALVIDEYPTLNFIYKKILKEHTDSVEDDSFHSAESNEFFDAAQSESQLVEIPDGVDHVQAIELVSRGVTSQDQLAAAETADDCIVDLERATRRLA